MPRTSCCAGSSASTRPRSPNAAPTGSGRASVPTARGRRSTRGHRISRPPSRRTSRCGWPAIRPTPGTWSRRPSSSRDAGGLERSRVLHAHLDGAVRALVVARPPGDAARGHAPAAVVTRQHLRLRVLGAPDGRRAHRRRCVPSGARPRGRHRRAADWIDAAPAAVAPMVGVVGIRRFSAGLFSSPRPGPARIRTASVPAAAARRARGGGALDRRPPGGRRVVGRHPAAVGLLPDRAAPPRLPDRPSRDGGRPRRPRHVHARGRREPPARGVPVAGVGHRARRRGAGRRRRRAATTPRSCARPTGSSARRSGCAATGASAGPISNRPVGRSSSRTSTTPTSTTPPRSSSRCGGSSTPSRTASTPRSSARSTWQRGMQCRDGGWAAFDVDNTRRWPTQLPFCDFGEVIDPPSADVTAHTVEMFAALGRDGRRRRAPGAASTGWPRRRRPTGRGSAVGA